MTAPVASTGYVQDNAASVRGVAGRFTRLGPDGAPVVGSSCDVYITSGFIKFSFTPEYSEGEEISITNAAGTVCVYYKSPDTLKNVGVGLELCDPDPVLTQMLVGGEVLQAAGNSDCAPLGSKPEDVVAVGYASELLGQEGGGDGVAVEVWAQAVVGGKAAASCPFWRYLIPYSKFRLDGDRVVENGNLATVFKGTGGGNAAFGPGPNVDMTGVTPTPAEGAFDWGFPTYTDRPFLYARDKNAPLGLSGCFTNLGIPIVAIVAGIPATLVPVNASRPKDLPALIEGSTASGNEYGQIGTPAWTPGQALDLLDGSMAHWNGTAWIAGRTPQPVIPATGASTGHPGTYSPPGATMPDNLAGLSAVTATPTTIWVQGDYVNLKDLTTAYWNGTAWALGNSPGPSKGSAAPGQTFPAEATITASDSTNAAKLTGLGYVAAPQTAWTTGQGVTIGTFLFHWDGAAWAAGAAA
jgi:hypothetical protein